MDFQNRVGGKTGTGGVVSQSLANADRRERLRKLAMDTIDLSKDPYFMKNHLGSYECRLCLTLHTNEGSYLAHTQGKKHQANLGRRAAREAAQKWTVANASTSIDGNSSQISIRKRSFVPIGRPAYKVCKVRDPQSHRNGLYFQVHLPQIFTSIRPQFRLMSAFEQKVEAPNRHHQYVVVAAEPYETIAFRIPARPVDSNADVCFSHWDPDTRLYVVQILFQD